MPNEVSFYPEIQSFIQDQFKSNFANSSKIIHVYWGIGELKANLEKIINENPVTCACANNLARSIPPLNLDVFGLITNGIKYELLILEVKKMSSVGLKEWSQLLGYVLVSKAKFGLLINIDGTASSRLSQIIASDRYISNIITINDDTHYEHNLGFMRWNSITKNFEYNSFSLIKSLSQLTESIQHNLYSSC